MPLDNFICLKQQTNKPSPKQKQIQGYAVGIKIPLRICWYFKAWFELGKKKNRLNHKTTDWLRLEGTPGGHLVQLPSSGRAT